MFQNVDTYNEQPTCFYLCFIAKEAETQGNSVSDKAPQPYTPALPVPTTLLEPILSLLAATGSFQPALFLLGQQKQLG